MILRAGRLIALTLALSASWVPMARAGDPAPIMLVLDASGSMWGRLDGRSKIVIVRDVINGLMATWDESVPVGLTAYGHRREGDCEDIEVLVPVGWGTAGEIISTVNGINPKGNTPLCAAVRLAATELGYKDRRSVVILVTDGLETCGENPCAVGAELAMSGLDFTAHVIAFDVGEEERRGLRCLAENTGGLFLAAADAAALRRALSETVAKAAEAPGPVTQNPGPVLARAPVTISAGTATIAVPDSVPAGSDIPVEWTGPANAGDYITIVRFNADEKDRLQYEYTSRGSPLTLKAPIGAGVYEVRYIVDPSRRVLARSQIRVTRVTANLDAPVAVEAHADFQVTWEGPDYSGDFITIAPTASTDGEYLSFSYTSRGNPVTLHAPADPAWYEVRYIHGRSNTALARTAIQVK